jgi:hypothetical protein
MTAVYRYFELPHRFSTYKETPRRCDVCGREAPGYAGSFYGNGDIEFVCEDCLSTGRLQEHGVTTNKGDVEALREQLRVPRADVSDVERNRLARERTVELEHRTPHPVTWQAFFWPAHCGDYCRFVKEVGKPELMQLSLDGDGEAFLAAHSYDIVDDLHAHSIWESIRPDIPGDGYIAYSVGVYLFRCLYCDEYVLHWDAD